MTLVVAPILPGFSLGAMGTPTYFAESLLSTVIAPAGSGKRATLVTAGEFADERGGQYYWMEFIVEAASFRRHNVSCVAASRNLLYTVNAQCPVDRWDDDGARLAEAALSMRLE